MQLKLLLSIGGAFDLLFVFLSDVVVAAASNHSRHRVGRLSSVLTLFHLTFNYNHPKATRAPLFQGSVLEAGNAPTFSLLSDLCLFLHSITKFLDNMILRIPNWWAGSGDRTQYDHLDVVHSAYPSGPIGSAGQCCQTKKFSSY
jgi:hypothetical protein